MVTVIKLSMRPWNIFCKLPYVVSSRIVVCNNNNSSIFTSSQTHAKFLAIFPDHLGEVTWNFEHTLYYDSSFICSQSYWNLQNTTTWSKDGPSWYLCKVRVKLIQTIFKIWQIWGFYNSNYENYWLSGLWQHRVW